jgi:hypothetical protein
MPFPGEKEVLPGVFLTPASSSRAIPSLSALSLRPTTLLTEQAPLRALLTATVAEAQSAASLSGTRGQPAVDAAADAAIAALELSQKQLLRSNTELEEYAEAEEDEKEAEELREVARENLRVLHRQNARIKVLQLLREARLSAAEIVEQVAAEFEHDTEARSQPAQQGVAATVSQTPLAASPTTGGVGDSGAGLCDTNATVQAQEGQNGGEEGSGNAMWL